MSKMKKTLLAIITLLLTLTLYSQEIENICILDNLKYRGYKAGLGQYPQGIYYDEVNDILITQDPRPEIIVKIDLRTKEIKEEKRQIPYYALMKKFGDDYWATYSYGLQPVIDNVLLPMIDASCGISFILKKDEGYIVYFIYEGGTPGAVDTTGKIYSNTEALAYLKEYDPEKYAESLARAEELGLKSDFERGNVLIWGKTYYSTNNGLEKVFGEPIYGHPELVQYDNQGYGYQVYLSNFYSYVQIVSNTQKTICMDYDINNYTDIFLSNDDNIPFSASWYVGYGGNIYYYIAGEEYTEVFRIRRTWGNPDMYAMAINGYTEDNYGKYVKNTLATMSKSDLRLLRNTIFALYGVHFKSEDLSKHFAKEVWYTDEGKTSGEVELPEHRQKLVEMIQELERK